VSDDDDLFAALQGTRLVNLVSEAELEQRAEGVARRIRREARRERMAGLRRWWVAVVAGTGLAVAGVGAVGANLLHREPDQQDLVWCYRWVPEDLTDEAARFGVLLIDEDTTTARWALDACYSNGDGTTGTIPDPVSQCVLADGNVAVIPIRKCSDLGLPESDVKQAVPTDQ
jgi:hypothetical protein